MIEYEYKVVKVAYRKRNRPTELTDTHTHKHADNKPPVYDIYT